MSATIRVELSWPEHNTVIVGKDQYFTLVRDGIVHLVASTCPHRGGPLHLGEVQDGRLRCPWHGSSFRVDRLCHRSVSVIQRGTRIVAYVPAPDGAKPVAAHTLVLAE